MINLGDANTTASVLTDEPPAIRFLQLHEDPSMPQCGGGGYQNLLSSHPSRAIIGVVQISELNTLNVRTENCRVLPNQGFPLGCTSVPGGSSWSYILQSARYE